MRLDVKNVGMTYSTGARALRDVELTLESPAFVGLLGPNGAGKSTLMQLLVAGLLPTAGQILLDGEALTKAERQLKSKLGYLPQMFGLYEELTVSQFLDYMSALKGVRNAKAAILKAIEDTNLVDNRNTRIRTLSGGQRQRVGIAQALLGDPELLIFDEPTVGLDPEERLSFRNLFSRSAQQKLVLLSTHIIEDVQSVCNRLIVIDHGAVLFDGRPSELIVEAYGHVGTFEQHAGELLESEYHVTARINTVRGILCRIVAETLPEFAEPVEPTLEDAYIWLIAQGDER